MSSTKSAKPKPFRCPHCDFPFGENLYCGRLYGKVSFDRHVDACQFKTEAERAWFAENGRWPRHRR